MGAMPIILDNDTEHPYRVRIIYNTLVRSFELLEGDNAGQMLSGRYERDLIGTVYSYQLSVAPDPLHREDYDRFYEAISAPVESRLVTMPYAQSTITFRARVVSGTDTFVGQTAGAKMWNNLTVNFIAVEPYRSVTNE